MKVTEAQTRAVAPAVPLQRLSLPVSTHFYTPLVQFPRSHRFSGFHPVWPLEFPHSTLCCWACSETTSQATADQKLGAAGIQTDSKADRSGLPVLCKLQRQQETVLPRSPSLQESLTTRTTQQKDLLHLTALTSQLFALV